MNSSACCMALSTLFGLWVISQMIPVKAQKTKAGNYRIPKSEISRLAKELLQEEAQLDMQVADTATEIQNKNIKYYTVTQASEILGIGRSKILKLVKTGNFSAIKGPGMRAPYLVPEDQLQNIRHAAVSKAYYYQDRVFEHPTDDTKNNPPLISHSDRQHEDLLQIQKNISEAMRNISSTQEQIALPLNRLIDKL